MAGRIAYYGNIVKDGLVLDLDAAKKDSYPGSGTVWRDISGNANNGTLTNQTFYTGSDGGAMVFDGADDYVSCGNNSSIQLTGDMSILAWIKVTNFSNYRGIVGKTAFNIPAPYDYYLVPTTGRADFYRGNGSVFSNVSATSAPTTNTWQHVAVTMLGTQVTHYLNKSTNGTGTLSTTIANGSNSLIIGNRSDLFVDFLGNIAIVQLYNRALSSTEIAQNYDAQKGRYGL